MITHPENEQISLIICSASSTGSGWGTFLVIMIKNSPRFCDERAYKTSFLQHFSSNFLAFSCREWSVVSYAYTNTFVSIRIVSVMSFMEFLSLEGILSKSKPFFHQGHLPRSYLYFPLFTNP